MAVVNDFFWCFSIAYLALSILQGISKATSMAFTTIKYPPSSSSPPSPSPSLSLNRPENSSVEMSCREARRELSSTSELAKVDGVKARKRPARLMVPVNFPVSQFGEARRKKVENVEFEVEGRDYYLSCKKGKREIMEDRYQVMLDIFGDHKQAFFAVIDGHGGSSAADYVAKNLGKNIIKAFENGGKEDDKLEEAIRSGYLVTDKEFLAQGLNSGACAASVLLKDGELRVANVGDCRVVLSKNGVANALTSDHRLSREDERSRIESTGGYVHYRNGVWRVLGSLAVSRAIGDSHLKQWIVADPEITRLRLTSDCGFLIIASDGLWDKVDEQEAVDVVLREKNLKESCKKLVDMSCGRGNVDDVTVMLINLHNHKFLPTS